MQSVRVSGRQEFIEGQNVAIEFRFAGVVSTACPN